MLEQFSISNYLSFKEKAIISFVPESITELQELLYKPNHPNFQFLLSKGIGFFGINSSGKSNLIKSIDFVKSFVLGEIGGLSKDKIENLHSFALDEEMQNLPSEFEFRFWSNQKKFRYGFIVNQNKVFQEWLLVIENKKEKIVFERNENAYYFGREYKKDVEIFAGKVRQNELFITFCSRLTIEFALEITDWFKKVTILQEYDVKKLASHTMDLIEGDDALYRVKLEKIMKESSFGIESIKLSKTGGGKSLSTSHNLRNTNELYWFDLIKNESLGTIKFFGLLGPIIKTLFNGGVLVIDEIDSGFHAELGIHLLNLFLKSNNEKHFPQLIFSSHNHEIWVKRVLRRDQQYHVIKNDFGESSLKRTYDYKVRKSKSVKNSYEDGELSPIPVFRQGNLFLDC